MKRILLLLIIAILFIPYTIKAADFEYEITAKVNLEGTELEDKEFSFNLLDDSGTVIQTKSNDSDGTITFDPIPFTSDDITVRCNYSCLKGQAYGYKIYMIQQVIENEETYILDKDTAYVGVYVMSDGTSEINYLKNIDKQIAEWTETPKKENSQVFHATEEDLQGQAYAVYDSNAKTLTFFRDEPGKYTDSFYERNSDGSYKTYYTNFEGDTLHAPWSGNVGIEKIIFQDPIKPKKMANKNLSEWGGLYAGSWFYSLDDLVEIENINLLDTSEVDSFNGLFESDKKLKELDLSAWDTSNVQDMYGMFDYCTSLEKVYLDNFDTSKVVHLDSMFVNTKIQFFDASIFETDSLRRANNMFDRANGVKGLDFSSWTVRDWYGTAGLITQNSTVRFVDVSSFTYLTSNSLMASNLSIMRLGSIYYDISTAFGRDEFLWYNIDNNTLYTRTELYNHLVTIKDLEPSTYIRPDLNTTPALFINKYITPHEEVQSSNEANEQEVPSNPETNNNLNIMNIIVLIGALLISLLLLIGKKLHI